MSFVEVSGSQQPKKRGTGFIHSPVIFGKYQFLDKNNFG